jgi:ectoine hydroxylase-related dioxygenase (phytanoyl-CoA dioxygenase family)
MAIELTPAQLHQYKEEGYIVVRNLIPAADMVAVRDVLHQIEECDVDLPPEHAQYLDKARVTNSKGLPIAAGVQGPATWSPVFKTVADHPNLQSVMSQLLGKPVERFTDQCGIKTRYIQTEQAGRSFYHQDSYYWHIEPERGCNCWIPTDEVGKDAIALAVMPGSQQGWNLVNHESYYDDPPFSSGREVQFYQRHRIPLDQIDFAKEALLPMHPGDGLFFTNYTWHRSEPNLTGKSLCFYAIAYQRAEEPPKPVE